MSAKASYAMPYMGLEAFSEEDALFFFGREVMSEIVSSNLMSSQLTVIYGPSGVGKSSLLRAGVINHLKRTAQANISKKGYPGIAIAIIDKWRDDPVEKLMMGAQEALAKAMDDPKFTLPPTRLPLAESLRAPTEEAESDLLIVLDQFEEYFLYHSGETGEGTFATEFPRLINSPDSRVHVLISIRDDSYTKLDLFKGDLFNLFDRSIAIKRLTREGARDAIRKPIEQYNLFYGAGGQHIKIEEGLVEEVLDQVIAGKKLWEENGRRGMSNGTKGQEVFVESTYLQLVMARLWQEETKKSSKWLRLETYKKLGGAEKIVKDHLETVLNDMPESQQKAAERLFYHLVTPSRTKIAYPVYDLIESGAIDREELDSVLETLSDRSRILRPVPSHISGGTPLYEIFHDVLAEPVLEWSKRRELEEQKQLAEKERQRAEEQKRIARLMRIFAITAATLFLLSVLVGLWAFSKKREAQKNAEKATKSEARTQEILEQLNTELDRRAKVDYFNSKAILSLYQSPDLSYTKKSFQKELQSYRKKNDQTGIAIAIHHLGLISFREGDIALLNGHQNVASQSYQFAEDQFKESIELLRKSLGTDHPYLAHVLNDLGSLYFAQAKFRETELPLREALDIWRKAIGLDARYRIKSLENLAGAYLTLGEYGKAEELYKEELEILREFPEFESLREARVRKALAQVYFEQERFEEADTLSKAEILLKEALELAEKDVAADSPELLPFFSSLSRAYHELGKDAEARSLFERASNIKGGESAYDYYYMGMLDSDQGKYAKAERLLKHSLQMSNSSIGSDYFNGVFTLKALASVYYEQNKFVEAEQRFKEALGIQEQYLGKDHPPVADTLKSYAALLRKMNREADATQREARAEQIRKQWQDANQK